MRNKARQDSSSVVAGLRVLATFLAINRLAIEPAYLRGTLGRSETIGASDIPAGQAIPTWFLSLLLLSGCENSQNAARAHTSENGARSTVMKLETDETPVRDGQQGELRIARGSRVGVRIEVIPAAVSSRRSPDQVRLGLHDSVVQPIADRLRRQGTDPFIFNLVNRDFSDKIGIRVTQVVDANRIGGPYCLTLIARQGRSYWSASIARPNGLNPNYQGIADDISGKENPERYFDSILTDSRMLANGLAQTIKIGEIGK
jgi:hypothetical protein